MAAAMRELNLSESDSSADEHENTDREDDATAASVVRFPFVAELNSNEEFTTVESTKKKFFKQPASEVNAKKNSTRQPAEEHARKRRRSLTSPEASPVATSNRFNVLPVDADLTTAAPDAVSNDKEPAKTQRRPPALMIKPLATHKELMTYIQQVAKSPFTAKPSGEMIKVCLTTIKDYHDVTTMLEEHKREYHTWAIAPERAQRVVIRGLPRNEKPEDILQDLKDQGYNPSAVVQLDGVDRETRAKRVFPLFAVTFRIPAGEPSVDLVDLKSINHCRVTMEASKQKTGPIQCSRCQRVGHKSYTCKQQERCRCCAGLHRSKFCPVPKSESAKCVNCQGSHPTNYQGCLYLKARKGPSAASRANVLRDAASRPPTTTSTQAAPMNTTRTAPTSGQRSTPRLRLEMPTAPVASPRTNSWVQRSDRPQNRNGESFPAIAGSSGTAAPQAAPNSGLYSEAAANRLQQQRTTTSETLTPTATPAATSTAPPPAQQEPPREETFNWKELIVKLAQFVADLDLHPTVTMLAKLVPSLLGSAMNINYGR
jgi:hypothetical protein